MKTLAYKNVNGDTVLITVSNGSLAAVWLFGCNIVGRINEKQKQYLLSLL